MTALPSGRAAPIGPSPAPASPETGLIFEAERAKLEGAQCDSKRKGFTGDGYVRFKHQTGDYIEWNVPVNSTGNYRLAFRYALKKEARPLELKVNGKVVATSLPFPSTGAWESWDMAHAVVALNKGANTVRLSTNGASGGSLDHLEVEQASH